MNPRTSFVVPRGARPSSGGHGENQGAQGITGPPRTLWGPRERSPRKLLEVTKLLGFLGFLRDTRILLGFRKDSHDLYTDLAIIYGDSALIWIWIRSGFDLDLA